MKRIPLLLLLSLATFAAKPQSADSVFSFSLQQSIDYSLQNHTAVLNAQLDNNVSDYKVKETVGMGLPQISTGFDFKDFVEIPTTLVPGEFAGEEEGSFFPVKFGTQYQAVAEITASQLLFDPSYLLGVKATKTYREIAQKNVTRTRTDVAVEVVKAYYRVLVLNESKKVVESNVSRVRKLRDDTKALYENGFVEKIDLDRIEVTYNNTVSEDEKFTRIIELSYASLKFQLGMNPKAKLILTDSLNTEQVKNLSSAVDNFDINNRIEYSLLKTQEKLWEYNVKRYKNGGVPKLYAYGTLSTTLQHDAINIFDPNEKWYPMGLIGAKLSFPLFDGFQRHAKVKQTEYELKKIGNDLSNFERGANVEIINNRNSLLNAVSTLNIQEKNLQLANDVARTSKIKYDQGVGSNLEILNAETSLKEAQANYYSAIYDAIVAKVNLEKALGKINY